MEKGERITVQLEYLTGQGSYVYDTPLPYRHLFRDKNGILYVTFKEKAFYARDGRPLIPHRQMQVELTGTVFFDDGPEAGKNRKIELEDCEAVIIDNGSAKADEKPRFLVMVD